jgi:GT2 family glycosyltransferase
MKKQTIAVCIPTYNQCHYLAECLESVFAQTLLPDEVWISDDASTDATHETVSKLMELYPNIRYTKQAVRLGMSGNPRWVVQQPKTDFVAKLDSDDKYKPKYLEYLVEALQSHPSAGYAHGDVDYINENSEIIDKRTLCRKKGYINSNSSLYAHTTGFKVTANIILYRRDALEHVDFFSPSLTFCDDWDIGVRLADKGWGNVYIPESLASYRVWTDSQGLRPKRILDTISSTIEVYEKSLTPAFTKRGWSSRIIYRARRNIALHLSKRKEISLLDLEGQKQAQVLLGELGMFDINLTLKSAQDTGINKIMSKATKKIRSLVRSQIIKIYKR